MLQSVSLDYKKIKEGLKIEKPLGYDIYQAQGAIKAKNEQLEKLITTLEERDVEVAEMSWQLHTKHLKALAPISLALFAGSLYVYMQFLVHDGKHTYRFNDEKLEAVVPAVQTILDHFGFDVVADKNLVGSLLLQGSTFLTVMPFLMYIAQEVVLLSCYAAPRLLYKLAKGLKLAGLYELNAILDFGKGIYEMRGKIIGLMIFYTLVYYNRDQVKLGVEFASQLGAQGMELSGWAISQIPLIIEGISDYIKQNVEYMGQLGVQGLGMLKIFIYRSLPLMMGYLSQCVENYKNQFVALISQFGVQGIELSKMLIARLIELMEHTVDYASNLYKNSIELYEVMNGLIRYGC